MTPTTISYSNQDAGHLFFSTAIPEMDLPPDASRVDPQLRLLHKAKLIDVACDWTVRIWRKALTSGYRVLRSGRTDLKSAARTHRRAREKSDLAGTPDGFGLATALLFLIVMLVIEFLLSLGTIGPAFGFEPGSWQSIGLAALVLGIVGASHLSAAAILERLQRMTHSMNPWTKTLAVALDLALACGILAANYKAIAALAPLRQQVAVILQGNAEAVGLIAPAESIPAPGGSRDTVDDSVIRDCVYLLSVIVALDSILLSVFVHRQVHRFHLRNEVRESGRKRDEVRDRVREAKKEYLHARNVWKNRDASLEVIRQAMLTRERCLLFPSPEEEKDVSPRAWVNKTLSQAGRLNNPAGLRRVS